jgi:hypothetical protein
MLGAFMIAAGVAAAVVAALGGWVFLAYGLILAGLGFIGRGVVRLLDSRDMKA